MAIRENRHNKMHQVQEEKLVLLGKKVPLSVNPVIVPKSYVASVHLKEGTMNKSLLMVVVPHPYLPI